MTVTAEERPFTRGPTARAFARLRVTESILTGPAGTGKSRLCLELLHQAAQAFPEMRALIVRKTRESLTESALVTFEEKVVPPSHPVLEGASRRMRQAYTYTNGSTIVIGGLDKPSRIMSTEYDVIYVQEAIELLESEWETLITRLRNGKMPYQRIIGDTNPDRPRHWIRDRAEKGRLTLVETRHEDNPLMWDGLAWTPYGLAYLEKLDALTGPRKDRLRFGRWVQAEGLVYGDWNPAVHLVDKRKLPAEWTRLWVVDFGLKNPFVFLVLAVDGDGRLWLEREIYRTGRIVEDLAKEIRELTRDDPRPSALICDHDAEDRATIERHLGMPTIPAQKDVLAGIQAVSERLRVQADGKPRLLILRGAREHPPDETLDDAKKPTSTAGEFDGYVWDTGAGRKAKEAPLKKDDHGLDALRYGAMHLVGSRASVSMETAAARSGPRGRDAQVDEYMRRTGSLWARR